MHFNKLHSNKNGQFISGDGDSDGTIDEHHRYTNPERESTQSIQQPQGITSSHVGAVCTAARMTAGRALTNAVLNKVFYKGVAKDYKNIKKYVAKNTGITKAMKTSNWKSFKKQTKAKIENKAYGKAAETINKKLFY